MRWRVAWLGPGEFTDDTQVALLVAESLLENDGLDESDLFDRFRTWAEAYPPDIGNQTRAVLGSGGRGSLPRRSTSSSRGARRATAH